MSILKNVYDAIDAIPADLFVAWLLAWTLTCWMLNIRWAPSAERNQTWKS